MDTHFLKIGHRGAMGYEPENTLISFKRAIDMGVDMVEFDVHVCKSGEVVVIHDESVDRTTNGTGFIVEKTLTQLKELDAGKGQKIPTLEEVLDLIDKRIGVNIELKALGSSKPTSEIINKYISNGWNRDLFLISSFNIDELREFKKLDNQTRVGIIFEEEPSNLVNLARELDLHSISLGFFNEKIFKDAKSTGLKFYIWTINSKKEVFKLKQMGVDGIFTNYPDVF